jgi:hypothetical protein
MAIKATSGFQESQQVLIDLVLLLPAAKMRPAIDVQDVTRHRRGVGQVEDCVRNVPDRGAPPLPHDAIKG